MNEENQHESLNADMQEYAFEHIDKVYQQQALHDRQTLVISAFGGPGSGKTVACMDICQQLKKRGYNAEYVSEVAKDYVYDENFEMLDGTAEHQYEILQEQLKRVDRYIGKVDFVVTDSPILLNGIYNQQLTPEYARTLLEIHGQYNNFVFFVNRDKTQFQQEGRIHDLQESMEKDLQIQNLLDDNKIYYGTYNHETVGKIVDNSIHTLHRIRDAHSNQLVKDFVLQNYQEGYVDIEKVDDLKYKLTDKTGDSMEVIIEKDKIVVPEQKGENNMAKSIEAKDVLFCYKVNGFEAYYNMGDIELEDLRHLYWQIKQPFVNMPGKKLTEAEHAEMEQSNQVRMSVTADVDNNEWTVYEINGIPEDERTDFNTEIKTSILDYDKDMLYANLTNQEAAALRMALKHEMKQPGSGEQHLEAWIEKQQFQRKELGLPLQNKQMDLMRTMYRQMDIIQKLGRLEIDKELPGHMRLTKWNENNHVFEPVTKILSADSTELYNSKFQKQLEYLQGSKTGKGQLFIPEKELNPVYQAKGWERYDDGSGKLVDVNGKTLVSFDLETNELMGKNLPFTEHELYKNYSYDSCGFEKIREDAVRWLNNNYESALERANELVEPYRQDADNYYKVVSTENPEYPFNVQKITSGYYSGNGKFCKDIDEVKEYVEGEHLNEITDKTIEDAMEIDEARLDELAEEMLLEAQAASQGPILGM